MSKPSTRFTVTVANGIPAYSTGEPIPGIVHLTEDYAAVLAQLNKETAAQLTTYIESTWSEVGTAAEVWKTIWSDVQKGEGEDFMNLVAVLSAVEINANDLSGALKKAQAEAGKTKETDPLVPYIKVVGDHWATIDKAAEAATAAEAKAEAEKKTETVPPVTTAPKNAPAKPQSTEAPADGLLGILTNLKTQADAGVATDAAIDEAIAALQRAKSSNMVTGQASFATVQLVIQQLEAAGITLPEGVGTPALEATNAQA